MTAKDCYPGLGQMVSSGSPTLCKCCPICILIPGQPAAWLGTAGPWGLVVSSHIYVCNTMSRWTPDTDTILTLQTMVIYCLRKYTTSQDRPDKLERDLNFPQLRPALAVELEVVIREVMFLSSCLG